MNNPEDDDEQPDPIIPTEELCKDNVNHIEAWLASILAGTVRAAIYVFRTVGVSATAVRTVLTKQAFLYLRNLPTATGNNINNNISPIHDPEVVVVANKARRAQPATVAGRIASLVKGTILGVAVFGIYDYLVFQQWAHRFDSIDRPPRALEMVQAHAADTADNNNNSTAPTQRILLQASVRPTMDAAPLLVHFGAGWLAGLVESAILDLWEIASYWWFHGQHVVARLTTTTTTAHLQQVVNGKLILRRAVFHSVGYGTLFGSYECIRRFLTQHVMVEYLTSKSPSVPVVLEQLHNIGLVRRSSRHDDDDAVVVYDMTLLPVATALIAGGLAGQAHFVTSHYLRQWKHQAAVVAKPLLKPTMTKPGSMVVVNLPHHRQPYSFQPPTVRACMGAFWPTALCFVVFQYGGEVTERWIRNDVRPFPAYMWAG